ncbi:MAG: hypothetical protein ROO76_05730 [Terriglobia bacterium]|nr:hypothetical protein [Terriglobia bacterium]
MRETKRKSLHISSSSLQGYHLSSRRYYTNTGTGRPQQHSIQINNLQTNTIYYFFVDSGQLPEPAQDLRARSCNSAPQLSFYLGLGVTKQ